MRMQEPIEEPKQDDDNLESKLFKSDDSDDQEKLSMFSDGSFHEQKP